MPDSPTTKAVDLLTEMRALLREGKVQEVDNALTAAIAAAPPSPGAAGHGAAASPAPRPASQVVNELLTAIVDRLGNHPALKKLLEELAAFAVE